MNREPSTELCDCNDCQYSENPCHMDCEPGPDECYGCAEAREIALDADFEAAKAQGLR
jgi:hypothetical protein